MDQKDIDAIVSGVAKLIKPKAKLELSGELDLYGPMVATSSIVTAATAECPEDEWWHVDIFCGSDNNSISSGSLKLAKRRTRVEETNDVEVGFQANPTGGTIYFSNSSFWVFPGQKLVAVFSGAAAGDKLELWATGRRHKVSKE